uniref:CASP-like protein n=1 Tax=Oryza punctata TaxID=4537 RepID=A0A0E0MN73_ORYPU
MAGGGGDGEGGKEEGHSASEAASIVFRIVTVGLSLASAITTAASTQCVYGDDGRVAGTASYSDYHSFRYAAAADLVSAVLQGVAIYLEAVRKEEAAKVVELLDKLVQALTSSSAALLLAVADITSCGLPRSSRRGGGRRQQSSLCSQPGRFCGQVRVSSAFSLLAATSFSVSVYTRHAAKRASPPPKKKKPTTRRPPRTPSPERESLSPPRGRPRPRTPPPGSPKEPETPGAVVCPERPIPHTDQVLVVDVVIPRPPPTPTPPRPYVGCPRLTIPCSCENPELCAAFF